MAKEGKGINMIYLIKRMNLNNDGEGLFCIICLPTVHVNKMEVLFIKTKVEEKQKI